MKNKLISDQFALYDKAFDQACSELKLKNLPTQKHRWLYRYLQISPPYMHAHAGTIDQFELIEEDDQTAKSMNDMIRHSSKKLYQDFGDIWRVPFHTWWFTTGKKKFVKPEPAEIHEFFHKYRNSKTHEDGTIDLYLEKMREDLTKLYKEKDTHYFILGVPLANSIEDNMKLMKRFLKENSFLFNMENTYGYVILKNKITIKALENYYRVLEIAIKNKDSSLVDVAKDAKALNISLQNLGNKSITDSTNSVRAGTSRQIQIAVEIAEQAAGGAFPLVGDWPMKGMGRPFEPRNYNVYREALEFIYGAIESNQFNRANYLATIRRDLKAIRDQID